MERQNGLPKTNQFRPGLVTALAVLLVLPVFAQESSIASGNPSPRLVLVSIPDRKVAVIQDGAIIAAFSVAVGAAATPSPTGEFKIVSRVANPTYYHPGTVIPPGQGNPLGTRWVGLSQKGYGIHGTNAPRSIGHARSHGCIRLRNRDMEKLFTMVHIGDLVQIHPERDEQVAQVFGGVPDEPTLADAQTSPAEAGQ